MKYRPKADWAESIVYQIKSYKKPPAGKFIDFRKIIEYNKGKDTFQEFPPSSELWTSVDQAKICMEISDKEYSIIENAFDDSEYSIDEHGNIDVLVGLLEYNNSRATSFANLLIALIFGTVTLAAIIQSIAKGFTASSYDQIPLIATGFVYFLFVMAGYYAFKRYSSYAGIADTIKTFGLQNSYTQELRRLPCNVQKRESNLFDFFTKTDAEQGNSLLKRLLKRSHSFEIAYVGALLTLAVIVYWSAIIKLEAYFGSLYFSMLLAVIALLVIGVSAILFILKRKNVKKIRKRFLLR